MKPTLHKAARCFLTFSLLFACYAANAQSEARTRIALNGGWAYRIAPNSKDMPAQYGEIMNKMRPGLTYGADFTYYIGESWGLGAKYVGFSNSLDIKSTDIPFDKITSSIQFFGPSFSARLANTQTGFLHLGIALGYIGYVEKDKKDSATAMKWTGGSFGSAYDIGYDLRITDKIYIGAQLSLLSGTVTIKSGDVAGSQQGKNNLSQINLFGGIRFTL